MRFFEFDSIELFALNESTLFDKVSESLNRVNLLPLLTFPKLLFVADLWLLIARFVFFISKIIFKALQEEVVVVVALHCVGFSQ